MPPQAATPAKGKPSVQQDQGDEFFWGVDLRDPRTVGQGMLADGLNLRFVRLVPETRKGVVKPMWAHRQWGGKAVRWGSVQGAGRFRDPNGIEGLFLAAEGAAYWLNPYNLPRPVPLPDGVRLRGPVKFVQAFDQMFAFRGRYLQPLVLSDFSTGFEDLCGRWDAAKTYHGYNSTTLDAAENCAFGPWEAVSSVSRTGTTVTVVTSAAHGYVTGADITLRGATPAAYNGRWNIDVVDGETFTFELTGNTMPDTPATGTLTCSNMALYWKPKDNLSCAAGVAPYTSDPTSPNSNWQRDYQVLPNAATALFTNNRLFVPTAYIPSTADDYNAYVLGTAGYYGKVDFIVACDYLDPIHFDFTNELRINQGDAGEIVDLAKFNDTSIVVWKTNGWGVLSSVGSDLTSVTWDNRSNAYGISSQDAWAVCGNDLIFMAGRWGLVSVRQSENAKAIAVDLPLSAPIQPLIDRINWTASDQVRLENWHNRLYVAVALDGSASNNGILVHDFVSAARARNNVVYNLSLENYGWTPLDQGTAICPAGWVKCQLDGEEKLLFWGEDGWLNILEESGAGDQVADPSSDTGLGWEEIESRWVTRAYWKQIEGQLTPNELCVAVQTWNPSYSIKAIFGGVNKETIVASGVTRDRTKYLRPWDALPWDASNVNDDHDRRDRADYSVVLPDGGLNLGSGVELERFQEAMHTLNLMGRRGRSFQISLVNTQGRVRLLGARLSAVPSRNRHGIQT